MIKNHIDLTITEEQAAAMDGWLDLLQESMSALVSISGAESRRLFKLGAKSEAFVRTTLDAATEHESLLPTGIRENMERDAALRERLRPLIAKLQHLLALVEGSYKLAGADLMKNGTVVYQILRLNGYGAGLEPLLEELGTRFARPRKKNVPAVPTPAPARTTGASLTDNAATKPSGSHEAVPRDRSILSEAGITAAKPPLACSTESSIALERGKARRPERIGPLQSSDSD